MTWDSSTRRVLLHWGVALVAGTTIGCGKGSGNAGQTATDTTQSAAAAPAAGATATSAPQTGGAAGEATANPAISSWSDSNIVATLSAGDRAEVQLARLAESKAVLPPVKDFAKTLVTDHSKGEKEVQSLETTEKLHAKPAAGDTSARAAQDFLRRMQSMPKGKDWDSTFVKHEYDDHRQDIADAKAMQNQAKDAQLKQLLADELPVLQKHLDDTQKLLGYNPGGTAAWKNAEVVKTPQTKGSGTKK